MRKDLGLWLDEARRIGCSLPVAALVDQSTDIQAMARGRWDTSSLIRDCGRRGPEARMDVTALQRAAAELRPTLLRIARLQLRNDACGRGCRLGDSGFCAQGADRFGARSQLKTWLVGILKTRIIDQFRRCGREVSLEARPKLPGGNIRRAVRARWPSAQPAVGVGRSGSGVLARPVLEILQMCVEQLPARWRAFS